MWFSRIGGIARRDFLRAGFGSIAFGAAGVLGRAPSWAQAAADKATRHDRILVVVELTGGNDGLNTVVPYGDDAYYRARPRIGIRPARLRKLDDHFGFQYTMAGFERLYKDGRLAIVHGVGYEQPSFSHFSSMAYWQTAAPNRGDLYGWVGRLADAMDPEGHNNYVVNVDTQQSLAVRSRGHVPLVFDDPEKFIRSGFADEKAALPSVAARGKGSNAAQDFIYGVSRSALNAEQLVRDAWAQYRTPVDYGLVRFGLDRVAALIAADFPTRIYYVAYRNNAFDTHVYLHVRPHRRLRQGRGAARARRRRDADGVQRVRPPGEGEHQPGHRSRHRRPGLHDRRAGRRRPVRQDAEPHRIERRQHGVHHRFPPRLRDRHQELHGL
jgi:uncharacterized protein (DUF1501 family)